MKYIEEEKTEEVGLIEPETVPQEDPSVKKGKKKAAIGLTVPAVIFACVAIFLFIMTFLLWNGFNEEAAKETSTGGEAAGKVFGILFIALFYFIFGITDLIASGLSLGLSIGLLVNNSKKKLHKWYPILILCVSAAIIIANVVLFIINRVYTAK